MRGVEERIGAMLAVKPERAGLCLRAVRIATGLPWVAPDATGAYRKAKAAGAVRSGHDAPRGAFLYWEGGAKGHGHIGISLGDGTVASTDVHGGGTVGVVPFGWFAKMWPALKFRGWSWFLGPADTEPKPEPTPAPAPVKVAAVAESAKPDGDYVKHEDVKIAAGEWHTFHRQTIAKGSRWWLGMQVRIPAGVDLEFRLARVGWGDPKDTTAGVDVTGYRWFPTRYGKSQGQTAWHNIAGGGPVEWQVRCPKAVTLPTLVAKWEPAP